LPAILFLLLCTGGAALNYAPAAHAAPVNGNGSPGANGANGGQGGIGDAGFGGSSPSGAGGAPSGGVGGAGANSAAGTGGGAGGTLGMSGTNANPVSATGGRGGDGTGGGAGGGGGVGRWIDTSTTYQPLGGRGGTGGEGSCDGSGVCGGAGAGGTGIVVTGVGTDVRLYGTQSVVNGGLGSPATAGGGAGGGGTAMYIGDGVRASIEDLSLLGGVGGAGGGNSGAAMVMGSNAQVTFTATKNITQGGVAGLQGGVGPAGTPVGDGLVFAGSGSTFTLDAANLFAGNGGALRGVAARFVGDNNHLVLQSGTTQGTAGGGGVVVGTGTGPGGPTSVAMEGNNNTLELRGAGRVAIGLVQGAGTGNTLALGGDNNAFWDPYTNFDVSQVSGTGTYQAFEHLAKTGSGTWTLTGQQGSTADWTVRDGVLRLSADGDISAARRLTLGDGASPAGGTARLAVDNVTAPSVSLSSLAGTRIGEIDSPVAGKKIIVTNGLGDTYAGRIVTTGGLEISGGTQIFTGNLTYTGGTQITGGTMQIGNGSADGSFLGDVDVAAGGTLALNKSGTTNFYQTIRGAGAFHQMGPGTTVLGSAQTFTGGSLITGGALQLGDGLLDGDLSSNVNTGLDATQRGTLDFNQAAPTYTFNHDITGTGNVVKAGAGTVILAGNNTHTGGTRIAAGTLQVGNGATAGALAGDVDNEGTLVFNRSDTLTYAGNITGSGALVQAGTGTTVLTGNSAQSGGTTINAGTLQVGAGGTTGTVNGNITNNGTLAFNRSDAYAFNGDVAGTGSLSQLGAGTTVLTGNSTYTGGTSVQAGVLQIGAGSTSGSIGGDIAIANGATVALNRGGHYTLGGALSGAGTLDQRGPGTTIVTGNSPGFGGHTNVSGGTLEADGTLGSAASTLAVANDATLRGIGTVGGNTTIGAGGILAGQQGDLPLRFGGDLTLSPGAVVNASLSAANPADAGLFNVAQNLTLGGTLNIFDLGTYGPGVTRLFDYGGALADTGFVIGRLPTNVTLADVILNTATPGQVNLINAAGSALNFWDGGNPANHGNGIVDGGDGTWDLATPNWTADDGAATRGWTNGQFAVFQGASGTVTVDNTAGQVQPVGAHFVTSGYRIQGGDLALTEADTVLRVGNGTRAGAATTATIATPLTGLGGIEKTDYGTLVLSGTNTYIGPTTISGGTLQLGEGGNSGSILGDVTNNATLTFNRSDASTFGGTISGRGQVVQAGSGTTILTANHTYVGGTTIQAGTLQLGNGGASGAIVGGVLNNGTLAIARADDITLDGRIDGTGSLRHIGTGTTTLTANNTYTGVTSIEAGTLQLGNGGTSGTIAGPVNTAAGTTLAINRSDNFVLPGSISGGGALVQNGTGTTVLTADSSHTGGTTLNAGTLQLGNGGASGALTGNVAVAAPATLGFKRGDTYTYGGTISGAGGVLQSGAGTTVFTGPNTYTGATVVALGALRQGAAGAFSPSSSYSVQPRGTLDFGGVNETTIAALSNAGLVSIAGATPGTTLRVNGNYDGHGTVAMNTFLNEGGPLSNQQTDRLLIAGNVTGTTALRLNVSGPGANTNTALNNQLVPSEGISLVQVGGSANPSSFNLAGGYVAAPNSAYQYRLFAYGPGQVDGDQSLLPDGTNWDYRLSTAYLDEHGNPVPGVPPISPVPPGPPVPPAPSPGRKAIVPEGSSLLVAGLALRQYGATIVDGLHHRLGDIRRDDLGESGSTPEGFIRAIGKTGQYRSSKDWESYGFGFRQDMSALQLGGNWLKVNGDNHDLRLGVAAAVGSTRVYPYASSAEDSDFRVDAQSLALTGTWQHVDGWYVDAVAGITHYGGKIRNKSRGSSDLDGNGVDVSLEAGKTLVLRNGIEVEPQAQLLAQALKLDRTSTSDRVEFSQGTNYSMTGRVGVRVGFPLAAAPMWKPFVRLDLLHTWEGAPSVKLGQDRFSTGSDGSAVRVGLGASGQLTKRLQLWGEADGQQRLGGAGFSSISGIIGLRYTY